MNMNVLKQEDWYVNWLLVSKQLLTLYVANYFFKAVIRVVQSESIQFLIIITGSFDIVNSNFQGHAEYLLSFPRLFLMWSAPRLAMVWTDSLGAEVFTYSNFFLLKTLTCYDKEKDFSDASVVN